MVSLYTIPGSNMAAASLCCHKVPLWDLVIYILYPIRGHYVWWWPVWPEIWGKSILMWWKSLPGSAVCSYCVQQHWWKGWQGGAAGVAWQYYVTNNDFAAAQCTRPPAHFCTACSLEMDISIMICTMQRELNFNYCWFPFVWDFVTVLHSLLIYVEEITFPKELVSSKISLKNDV